MTRDEIIKRFTKDAGLRKGDHGELVRLGEAGWLESCPSESCWHFDHPKDPDLRGVQVDWHFDGRIEVRLPDE